MLKPSKSENETRLNWDDLWNFYKSKCNDKTSWVFRGLENAKWELKTTLELDACERLRVCPTELDKVERGLVRDFQRKAHHYAPSHELPKRKDFLGWLALMRHHGAPTRLMDWTYSFWVAVHFATFKWSTHDKKKWDCPVIWTLNVSKLKELVHSEVQEIGELQAKNEKAERDNRHEFDAFKKFKLVKRVICSDDDKGAVYPFTPFKLNRRLVHQNGLFVVPCNVRKSFRGNIEAVEGLDSCFDRVLIEPSETVIKDILSHLRQMNISEATLFPGLDGFARSQRNYLHEDWLKDWRGTE